MTLRHMVPDPEQSSTIAFLGGSLSHISFNFLESALCLTR